MLKNIKMRPKLIGLFLVVGLIPLIAVAAFSILQAQSALERQAYDNLEAVHEIKRAQLEMYFAERQSDLNILVEEAHVRSNEGFDKFRAVQTLKKARLEDYFQRLEIELLNLKDDPYVRQALDEFHETFQHDDQHAADQHTDGEFDTVEWEALARQYDPRLHDIQVDNGWTDLYLIYADGDIIYSTERKSDLGMNILDSELKDTGLGWAFEMARGLEGDEVAVGDFAPYGPAGGGMAAFMMAPMHEADGTVSGYVAFEMPKDMINAIVQERTGMGQTGETYLVGELDGQTAYRSDRVVKEGKIGQARGGSEVDLVLGGQSGEEFKIGSTGALELSVFNPLDIPVLNWGMVSTIAVEEVMNPHVAGEKGFYADYIEAYSYYDLFLIDRNGYVFHTVQQESDYQTNMVDGPYAGSNLGRLIQEVLQTKRFGFADFEEYEPSGGLPAAFVAEPFLGTDGEVYMIVALQLSLGDINEIMAVREGMGESGEAYLVGPDKRMRSDSYQDPAGHSVVASFAGTVQENGVDTIAVTKALAGTDSKEVLVGYDGHRVLSAYGPVEAFDTTWAAVAEIDQDEVNAPARQLTTAVIVAGIITAMIVGLLGLGVALSLAAPIQKLAETAGSVAEGDVSQEIDVVQRDEVGQLAEAFRQMIGYLQEMAGAARRLAEGDVSADVTPRSEEDALGHAFRQMIGYQREMATAADRMAAGDLAANVRPQSERDRLGHAFRQMISNLRQLIGQVADSANGVGVASEQMAAAADQAAQATAQVAATVQQVAQGTAQQTDSVMQTTSSVAQMGRAIDSVARGSQEQAGAVGRSAEITAQISTAVRQVAGNAQAGAQGSAEAAQVARQGAQTVEETIHGIESIRAKVGFSAEKVREMGRRSEEIGAIIETIDDIASQTDLLALNAAIEAARAGEHGKGFAVVATAVGDLANKSAEATKEVGVLIKDVQRAIAEAVRAMEEGTAEVNTGVARANQANQALGSILAATEQTNRQMAEIAAAAQQMDGLANELVGAMDAVSAVVEENTAATEEMAASSSEVSQSIENIAGISEENSASAEEVAAIVEEVNAQVEEVTASALSLSEMAQTLQALVAQFNLTGSDGSGDNGADAGPVRARPQPARVPAGQARGDGNGYS